MAYKFATVSKVTWSVRTCEVFVVLNRSEVGLSFKMLFSHNIIIYITTTF